MQGAGQVPAPGILGPVLPITTTRVDLYRPLLDDGDAPVARQPYRVGLLAVVHSQSGSEQVVGGQKETATGRLDLGVNVGLKHWDQVYDRSTQEWWEFTWVKVRVGLGLYHVEAGLKSTQGVSIG